MNGLLKNRFNNWNLDKKIYVTVTSLNYTISIILIVIFTSFYISSFIKQSTNITMVQLSSLAANYRSALNTYKELAEALNIDDSIQEYLKHDDNGINDFKHITGVKNTMQNVINMHSNMRFIAIVDYESDNFLYKCNISKISTSFKKVYSRDYAASRYSCESGTLRLSFNDAYLNNGNNMLNVYMPIYSISNMFNEPGLLCMIFANSLFEDLPPDKGIIDYDSELFIVDTSNQIVSCSNTSLIGTSFRFSELLKGTSGNFVRNNTLYNYYKIDNWHYYLISRIPLFNMYRGNIIVVVLLIFLSVMITFWGLFICKRIIHKTYQPLDNVLTGMNDAAEGKLDVRINMENVGVDFVKLANGFNYMMDKIITLMEQVKMEQQQMDQIRFNALQSQIQPHFLYNTLDCIHWQASADGNEELSIFVKALAQYYRLCLSKGKDIICLEQEIEHVRNYLIIQNMRYDNIIRSSIELYDDCRSVLIPKITLQPLVENSIYHGIKVKEGLHGNLKITAFKKDGETYIVVADNGTGMTDDAIRKINQSISEYDKDFGYGIRNVNKRIELLFGKKYGLHYAKNDFGGVTVTIRLPGDKTGTLKGALTCIEC